MHAIKKLSDRLIGLSATIGGLGLLFEVAVILFDVVGRAFGKPLYGSQDLITMTMLILVFGAMGMCDKLGGNIAVDIFERHFPTWFNRAIDAISAFIGAIIFLALAWAVYDSSKISVMLNLNTNLLHLPKAWFQYAVCGFSLLTALGMTLRGIDIAAGARSATPKRDIA